MLKDTNLYDDGNVSSDEDLEVINKQESYNVNHQ
jgi:hypothetical protein